MDLIYTEIFKNTYNCCHTRHYCSSLCLELYEEFSPVQDITSLIAMGLETFEESMPYAVVFLYWGHQKNVYKWILGSILLKP